MMCIHIYTYVPTFYILYIRTVSSIVGFFFSPAHVTPGAKALSCCKDPGEEPLPRCRANTPSSSETTASRPSPAAGRMACRSAG